MTLWSNTFSCPNCTGKTSIHGGICDGCGERLGRSLQGYAIISLWIAALFGSLYAVLPNSMEMGFARIAAAFALVVAGVTGLNLICRLSWTWRIVK
ncbi:hypothetical protein [Hyphomonas sp.]|uniref:hypothetical protein n=1 Tax=Hyphomonas sp. TaxID=87 RepID=UPI0025C19812|nr:hypothetical protein [Hyphomonas sp.]